MKRRVLMVVVACVLCFSMSLNVYAGTAYRSGKTNGTTAVSTSASLDVNRDRAIASTSSAISGNMAYSTSVILYYLNSNGHSAAQSGSGTTSATAGNTYSKGQYATSQHNVYGTGGYSSTYGNWSCSLTANV